jgi:hypothetical protein
MSQIPPSLYEPLARCLHEYQLSEEQERDLKNDVGFQAWYGAETKVAVWTK